MQLGGKVGVNVFVLITGYFSISAGSAKTSRLMKLWAQIFTYSVLAFAVFVASGLEPFGAIALLRHCLPILFSQWWFASTFFVLYLLSPYVNKWLNAFDQKTYQRFLILLTVCWSVIPTLTTKSFGSNSLWQFVYLYSLGGYIKIHVSMEKIRADVCMLLSAALSMLTFLSAVVFDVIGIKVPFFAKHATFLFKPQAVPIVLISLLLFVGFLKIDIGYRRAVNVIASATFGVYLIHDDAYMRSFLWEKLFAGAAYSESRLLIPYSIFVVAVVFIGCTLIELVRIYCIERNYMKCLNALARMVDRYKEKFLSLPVWNRI
jgi:surface polysaccharide O-acyltransferase-like enzyme